MNSLLIARAGNDADIVEAFIRHHAPLVNLIVVMDQGSRDGTRAILEALRHEGLPLVIVDAPALGASAAARLTEVYRKVVPVFGPELVWFIDAGRFVRGDRASLEGELGRLPPGSTAVARCQTYVPDAATAARPTLADPLAMITDRLPADDPGEYHAVLRRDPADDATLEIEELDRPLRRAGQALPAFLSDRVSLGRLAVRGTAQLTARLLHDWQAHRARHVADSGARARFAARALLDQILAGLAPTPEAVVQVALGQTPACELVRDPLPHDYATLRYLHLIDHAALRPLTAGTRWPAEIPSAATRATGHALDIAPLLDLCNAVQAERAIVMAAPSWAAAVAEARPGLDQHVPRVGEPERDIDLLFIPDMPAEIAQDIVESADPEHLRHIVYWPAQARVAGALADELAQWSARGWTPQLMRTLSWRALASYAIARRGALVLGPADPDRTAHEQAVCAALVHMDQQASAWIDPPASLLTHPLQAMGLEAPKPVAAPQAVEPPAPAAPRSVLILGAGRSGTSCLAGMFGAPSHHHARDLYGPQVSNPRGFFEAGHINDLNESMLVMSAVAHLGADGARQALQGFEPHQLWLARFPDAMPAAWNDTHRREIARAVADAPFVLKDPRMAVTAPAWLEAAPDALMLSIHRAPAITAESILKECRVATYLLDFRISMKDAFDVWRQAYRRAVKFYRAGRDVLFLRYEDLFDNARLAQLEAQVRAPLKREFADRVLNRTEPFLKVPPECEALHRLLEDLCALSFAGRRAEAEAAIDRHFAQWPDRPLAPALAASSAA